MVEINVDFEVFKALTLRRRSEKMTENDVIRGLLDLPQTSSVPRANSSDKVQAAWVVKGVTFPSGTQFRATYKGRQYTGVVEDGALILNGKRYISPSAAAMSITDNPVNGWRFWECLLPGSSCWKRGAELRNHH